jgi:hypothetical protein
MIIFSLPWIDLDKVIGIGDLNSKTVSGYSLLGCVSSYALALTDPKREIFEGLFGASLKSLVLSLSTESMCKTTSLPSDHLLCVRVYKTVFDSGFEFLVCIYQCGHTA